MWIHSFCYHLFSPIEKNSICWLFSFTTQYWDLLVCCIRLLIILEMKMLLSSLYSVRRKKIPRYGQLNHDVWPRSYLMKSDQQRRMATNKTSDDKHIQWFLNVLSSDKKKIVLTGRKRKMINLFLALLVFQSYGRAWLNIIFEEGQTRILITLKVLWYQFSQLFAFAA